MTSTFGQIPVGTVFHFLLRGEPDTRALCTKVVPYQNKYGRWVNALISDPHRPELGQWARSEDDSLRVQVVLSSEENDPAWVPLREIPIGGSFRVINAVSRQPLGLPSIRIEPAPDARGVYTVKTPRSKGRAGFDLWRMPLDTLVLPWPEAP